MKLNRPLQGFQQKLPDLSDVVVDGTSDVTVGIHVKAAGGGWGTIDDVELYSKH